MIIERRYSRFNLYLGVEDFLSYSGSELHKYIKTLPKSSRKWIFDKFGWSITNEHYNDVINYDCGTVSFSKEEMEFALNEFDNIINTQEGCTI